MASRIFGEASRNWFIFEMKTLRSASQERERMSVRIRLALSHPLPNPQSKSILLHIDLRSANANRYVLAGTYCVTLPINPA